MPNGTASSTSTTPPRVSSTAHRNRSRAVARFPTRSSGRCTRSPPTTRTPNYTASCSDYTWKPRTAEAAHRPRNPTTSTRSNASSDCERKAAPNAGNPSPPTLMGELCHHRNQRIPTKVLPHKARNGRPISTAANRRLLRTATATRPLSAATTPSGAESAPKSPPRQLFTPAHIGCDTPL